MDKRIFTDSEINSEFYGDDYRHVDPDTLYANANRRRFYLYPDDWLANNAGAKHAAKNRIKRTRNRRHDRRAKRNTDE